MAAVSSTSGPSVSIPRCVPGPSGLQADASSSPLETGDDLHAVTSSAIQAAGGGTG